MVELGELEKRHQDFANRKLRIVAISDDDLANAQLTQAKFPHLLIGSDPEQSTARAFAVIHEHMGPGGTDTNAPTTFLVDGAGNVRWFFRPERFMVRLSPDELLTAVDGALAKR
jgi:peroxiredoxin